VDNCQSVSANFVFFELFKAVERVEKLQRRRPHAGEEDAEEGMDRKVKKTMGSREEVNVTVPRTVTRNEMSQQIKHQILIYRPVSRRKTSTILYQTTRTLTSWSARWRKMLKKRSPWCKK
jgi:hypothetical protein